MENSVLVILLFSWVFIRPSFDGRIMVWRCPSGRPSVRSVVHNPCGQDIARTIWPRMLKLSVYTGVLYMDRGRSLFIFKVKGQISRSLGLYKEFWHLDHCGQDIARTIQSRLLKLSMQLNMKRGRSLFISKVKGQISRSMDLYKEFWYLDPCGQDIARNTGIQSRLLKLSMYT